MNSDDDRFPDALAKAMADTLSDPDEIAEALCDFEGEVSETLACFCAQVVEHHNSPVLLVIEAFALRAKIEELATLYARRLARERLEETDASGEDSE